MSCVPRILLVSSLAFLFSATRVAAAGPMPDVVADYRLDKIEGGKVLDEISKWPGAVRGQVELATGKSGRAIQLARKGYIEIAGSEQWLFPQGISIEAWICPAALDAGRIVDRSTPATSDGFCLDTHPGDSVRFITPVGTVAANRVLAAGRWTHVVAVHDAELAELAVYVDGKLAVVQNCGRVAPAAGKHAFRMGADPQGGNGFVGKIDEVRFYSRPLHNEDAAARFSGKELLANGQAAAPTAVVYRAGVQVDHAALLARNDVVYLSPAVSEHEALPVGNGKLCAMVWNADGLNLQLNHGDNLWHQNASARVAIRTEPPLLAGAEHFEQRLSLFDGTVRVQCRSKAGQWQATVAALADRDAIAVHLQGRLNSPNLQVELEQWRAGVRQVVASDAVALVEDLAVPDAPQFSRNMAVVVRADCPATTGPARREGNTLKLPMTLTPRRSADGTFRCTVYLANTLMPKDKDAEAACRRVLEDTLAQGWEKSSAQVGARRAQFWKQSFVWLTSPDGVADFMENLWFLHLHWMACGGEAPLAVKFNGGPFLVHRDSRSWGSGYWYQNTRELYWPLPAANHLELCRGFQRLYLSNVSVHRKHARELFGKKGLQVQETMFIHGEGDKRGNSYTMLYLSTGLECAWQLYQQAVFARDESLLRDEVLPFMKEAVDFYMDYAVKGADGRYHISPEDARETYWRVQDGMTSISALRAALPVLMGESRRLGVFADQQARWREFLDRLAPLPELPDGKAYAPCIIPSAIPPSDNAIVNRLYPPQNTSARLDKRFNSENPELDSIYPFGLSGLDTTDRDKAVAAYRNRPFQGSYGWDWSAICAARLGMADEAARLLAEHCRNSQHWPQGFWDSPANPYWAGGLVDCPYFDSAGVNATATTEMLLQSHGGLIRVWPAAPAAWSGAFRLRAEGGFMVASQRTRGQVLFVTLESLFGGPCRAVNPWGEPFRVLCGERMVAEGGPGEIAFPTEKGRTYLVERSAAPVSQMPFQALAPAPNAEAKYLGNPRRARRPLVPTPGMPMLGITRDGLTPARAAAAHNRTQASEAIRAVVGVKTPRPGVKARWLDAAGNAAPGPWVSDGVFGMASISATPSPPVAYLLELPAPTNLSAVVWSCDRKGERYVIDVRFREVLVETSRDGQVWREAARSAASSAQAHGQAVRLAPPAEARFVRVRFLDEQRRPAASACDEIELY